jgi:PAS domain S-box-containing protein
MGDEESDSGGRPSTDGDASLPIPEVGEGEERYRHLVETSPAPINLFDAEGTCVWGNDAVLDLLGLDSREDLVGRSIFEFIRADDHDTAREELRAVVEEKVSTGPTRMTLERDDGERREIQVATAPGRYAGRDIGQAVVVDVTSLHETERELREERRFVQHALDALEDVFFVVDTAGELTRWNRRAVEVSGYTDEQLAEQELSDLFVEGDGERARDTITTAIEEGTDTVELDVRTADGREIPFEFRCRRLVDPGGEVAGVVGIGRDVSEQRDRARQLRHFEQMLRHNIRTELTVILGLTEEIETGEADDPQANARLVRERADRLFSEADKVKQLVALLTRSEDPVAVDLSAVVDECVAAASRHHDEATITAETADDATAAAVPYLGDAVGELVGNAVGHSDRPEPTVTVTVEHDGDTCTVAVADDGPGIPAFEREILAGDREINQLQHGSGVGLWFVYWVVRLSDGEVTFADNDPRGSVVTVELPAAE